MSMNVPDTWHAANQRYLMKAIGEIRTALEKAFVPAEDAAAGTEESREGESLREIKSSIPAPPFALDALCTAFDVSSFERKILLMAAAAELDSRFAALYAAAHKDPRRSYPSFSLALATFADSHWTALSPERPLRLWSLVEVLNGDGLTSSALRLPERVLQYLAGVPCIDERLRALVKPLPVPDELVPSHRTLAEEVAAVWSQAASGRVIPIIELCGDEAAGKRALAAVACAFLGLQLHCIPAWAVPRSAPEIDSFLRLWEREAVLSSSALLLDCDDSNGSDALPTSDLSWLMEQIRGPLLVATRNSRRCAHRSIVLFEVSKPTAMEQGEIWRNALATRVASLNGEVDTLVAQFNLSSNMIRLAAGQALAKRPQDSPSGDVNEAGPSNGFVNRLWDACRVQSRPRLEGLAQRIEPVSEWDDLVLPEKQKEILSNVAIHVRQRGKVYQTWGFSSKSMRGLGISALFAGPSGTGKTMAAEVLAADLRLDLYRIDLSQIVSKYIGETEKNLRSVFDAAEEGAAVLLFDEADALFGKRSEVKDSHDRYANIEVSYLLQRMEAYRGLAILTTNRKSAIDQAFMRRIRFVVEFAYPEATQRAEIWRRVFPPRTPTENLRIDRLARLNAAGGHIRNIAMGAAFLAADAGEPVRMSHLLTAARSEFAKLEKPLTDAEIAGWV
jgi:ATPase family associated with various cellular activities (AAA)/Winged helix domain, variant